MKKYLLAAIISFLSLTVYATDIPDARFEPRDKENFEAIISFIGKDSSLPMPELVVKVAKHLVGTPYVAGTLEQEPEKLTINTGETDCILFVEMCIALSLSAKEDNPSFEKYAGILRSLRYRDGSVDGYTSRLHYTSEWVLQGEKLGYFREITSEIGGVPRAQKFNFMSSHPNLYKQLKDNPEAQKRIRKAEENLEAHKYWYIPKADIPGHAGEIRSGDIICFTDANPGLDIAHVAIAYRENGQLTFIHASSSQKKAVVSTKPLAEYTNAVKGQNGIRVIRLK